MIGDGESQKVRVVGFADLIARFEEVDLVKMDCEGAEHEIFEKNPELKTIKNFYIEYHPGGNKDALVGKLKAAGFKVESKPSSYDSRFGFILASRF